MAHDGRTSAEPGRSAGPLAVAALSVALLLSIVVAVGCAKTREGERPATPASDRPRPILHIGVEQTGQSSRVVTHSTGVDGARASLPLESTGAAWSPDGEYVAYVATGGMSLALRSRDGATRTLLNAVSNFHPIYPWPAWSPDGRRIAVIEIGWCETGSGISYLGIVDLHTGKSRRLGPYNFWDARGTQWGPTSFTMPRRVRWSPDGTSILVAWDKTVVLDALTGMVRTAFDRPGLGEWAADGRSINFIEVSGARYSREGRLGGMFLARSEGDEVKLVDRLVLRAEGPGTPEVVPDAADLAVSPVRGGPVALAYGSSTRRVSRVVIAGEQSDGRLMIDSPLVSTDIDGVVVAIEWSPDGRSLAAMVAGAAGIELRSLSVDEGTWTTIARLEIDPSQLEGVPKVLSWSR